MQRSTQSPTKKEERAVPGPNGHWKIQAQRCRMNIELLYVANCPNHIVALERLRATLSAQSLQTPVNEVVVRDDAMDQAPKFPGAPTIRINGEDVEPHSG